MSPSPGQPTLPAEGTYTDMEKLFLSEQPVNLWPSNQDSNFGQFRRVLTDILQEAVDQITTLYNEQFIDSADTRIASHEVEYGIPVDPTKPLLDRRAAVQARMKKTLFTRTRRREIVESFIRATQAGAPLQLVPEGIAMDAGGVPIYGENAADITSLYTITENITNFSYAVSISGTVTPDIDALTRELHRITPAGISFTVTNP